MNSTETYPDGLDRLALSAIERQVSEEIAPRFAPTSDLLNGTALERRNRRILARALAGVTAKYGVTLAQATAQHAAPVRPVRVTTTPFTARRLPRTEAA